MPTQPAPQEPTEPDIEDSAAEEAPLNRAARRAKVKQKAPTHVGPQGGRGTEPRSARGSSKRPS